ncbi:MAG: glycoside hydrolase family 2 TIM barrel-domain containing protein [Hyphomonas sp.]
MVPLFARLTVFLAALFALSACATAQEMRLPSSPAYVMTNAASRDGLDLSGSWAWSIDPYRDGMSGFHGGSAGRGHQRYAPEDVDAATREEPGALYEYDMRQSPHTTLPGAWIGHAPELRHYNGLMWYARDFDFRPEAGMRYFLRVDAANYSSQAFLNGKLAGAHEGGFTPATYEVTSLLKDGANSVTLGVDSQRTPASVPPPVTDWETYGGVTRDIRLIAVPSTFVDEAWIRLTRDGRIAATIRLDGPEHADMSVSVRIPQLGLTLTGRSNGDGLLSLAVAAPEALQRWTPDAPTLYDVDITAGRDRLAERIGFRTIEVRGEDILLNGQPIFLRGISLHEEELGASPVRAMTEGAARALLSEIKDGLHGNFVRLAHYPHSESTLRLADEMGLLVWSEVPVYWLIDWDNDATLQTARAMVAENIHRDRNRASIILWSVANETPVSKPRNHFLQTLISDVRTLDDTRLVTAALLTSQSDQGDGAEARIEDPLADYLDVMAVNTYNGWYGGMPLEDVHALRWPDLHGKPMIFSEFGAGALAGFHDPVLKRKFSEEYQADYYRETLAMSEQISFLRGMSPWILKDFRSPRRQHPVYQQGWNRKGLISETGRHKEAFGVLAAHYGALEETGGTAAARDAKPD